MKTAHVSSPSASSITAKARETTARNARRPARGSSRPALAAMVDFPAGRPYDLIKSTTFALIRALGARTTAQIFHCRRLGAALAHRIHLGIPDEECPGLSPSEVSAIEHRPELHWLVADLTLTFDETRPGQVAFLARAAQATLDLAVLAMPHLSGTGIGASSETERRSPRPVSPPGSQSRPSSGR
jgi:hypothetical protein